MSTPRDCFIQGEGILLRALRESDLDGNWYGWLNDSEVTWFQNKGLFPNTREKQEQFFRKLQADSSQVTLAIEASGKHVGNATLKDIDWIHRTAELGILLGEREFWSKGIGAQAWWLITRYGFLTLNLNKITARIFTGNEASLKASSRSGYLVEGVQAEQFFRHGVAHSVTLTGITASLWRERFGIDDRGMFSEIVGLKRTE